MTTPPRPASVPQGARYEPENPGYEWVQGELDADGKRHGPYIEWNEEGLLHGKCTYVHGKIEGINENYHPDGSVASAGEWKDGVLFDCDYFKPMVESPEPWPAEAGDNVWKIRYVATEDGNANITIRYFDKDDTVIGMDGEPLPPWPENVAETARWFPSLEQWVDGAIERSTNNQIGAWKWWKTDGELIREEDRRADGSVEGIREYEDGVLDKKSVFDENDVKVDYENYFDNGVLFLKRKKNSDGHEVFEAYFKRDGTLDSQKEQTWDGDTLVHRKMLGRAGILAFEATRGDAGMACVLYGASGKPSARGLIVGDHLAGEWELFDERGEPELTIDTSGKEVSADPDESLRWTLNEMVFDELEPKIDAVPQLAASKKIDWAELESAFGETEDFHRFLRGLVSSNARVRRHAAGSIYDECLHQGTVYEATAHVMPFVIDLLEHEHADVSSLLEMVHDFATNAAPWVREAQEHRAEREANAPPAGIQEPDDGEPDWTCAVIGTVEAVGERWSKLWKLMASDDEQIRQQVLSLASLPAPTPEIRKALNAFATDANETALMRAVAVEALSSIDGATPEELLAHLQDDSPLVRATTAIEIGLKFGPKSPDEVVDALMIALERREHIASDYHQLPFVDIHYLARLALAVGSIGSEKARSLTMPLCERIEDVDGASAPVFGRGLLALVLGRGERPFGKDFLRVLEMLAGSRSFNVFNVNAAEVLESWNLPRYAEPLGELVAELKKEDDPEAALHAQMHAD